MARLIDLETLDLVKGAGAGQNDRFCVMEAASVYDLEAKALKVNGITITDHPTTVSKVIAEFMRSWNDSLPDADRQKLKRYIPLVIGTAASAKAERRRSYMALDWGCRVSAPTWLRLIGKDAEAKAIEDCAPLVDAKTARAATEALRSGAEVARAAWDAARAAAWAAAWAAAGAAAGAAAWAAAWDAAWDAARAAAWDAARAAAGAAAWDAAWDAAGDAAWDAAGAAAWDAAWDAARDAAWDAARAAAGAAAWDALALTVLALQTSAFDLLDRMIAVREEVAA